MERSVLSCWKCGSNYHKRRDCTALVTKDSAIQNKKESKACFKLMTGKAEKEKEKSKDRLEVIAGALPSVSKS